MEACFLLTRVLLLGMLLQGGNAPEPDIRAADGLVTIRVTARPLSDVLDRLARATGMRVVYDSAPPRRLVSAALEGLSEREAITRLLEGLGVSYAFGMDSTGLRVNVLILSEGSAVSSPSRSVAAPPPPIEPEPEPPPELAGPGGAPDPNVQPQPGAIPGYGPGSPGFFPGGPGSMRRPGSMPEGQPPEVEGLPSPYNLPQPAVPSIVSNPNPPSPGGM